MIKAILPNRGIDPWGSGEYGASRGSRIHKGIDYACPTGAEICSPVVGEVTKLGYPYGDDLSYRYVEISDGQNRYRLFYVLPTVEVGDLVKVDDVIGEAQDIASRYDDRMTNHIHYEILEPDGNSLNPEDHHGTIQLVDRKQ